MPKSCTNNTVVRCLLHVGAWVIWFSISTVLYCFIHVWSLVGSVFSSISLLLEKCAATATHPPVNTRMGECLQHQSGMEATVRKYIRLSDYSWFLTRFEQFSWRSKELVGQAVPGYLVHWYQSTFCSNRHRFSSLVCVTIASDYSWSLTLILKNQKETCSSCFSRLVKSFSGWKAACYCVKYVYTSTRANVLHAIMCL